jgi:hypothetical protein
LFEEISPGAFRIGGDAREQILSVGDVASVTGGFVQCGD